MKRHRFPSIVVCCVAGLLAGNSGCPLQFGPQAAQEDPVAGTAIDLGGSEGSTWQVSYDPAIDVTLKTATESETMSMTPLQGPVQMAAGIVDLGSLCWRPDTLCPQQLLPSETMIVQEGRHLLVGFNRRGALAALAQHVGLSAVLDGQELAAPLGISPADQGTCGLGAASILLATVGTAAQSAPEGDGSTTAEPDEADVAEEAVKADYMKGRITLAYSGTCLILSGAAAMDPTVEVELAVGFTAMRY